MKLIVGLGNPNEEYSKTRHNVGFMILDYLANKYKIDISQKKHNGNYIILEICGEKVLLLKPQSYMNLSGEVIKKYINYYKINISDVLIIHDDLDMNIGKIKIIKNSNSGGHNGIKNISLLLNTKDYTRLKIGIDNAKRITPKDYVLDDFSKEELEILEKTKIQLENIIEDFIKLDYPKLTSKYNKKQVVR